MDISVIIPCYNAIGKIERCVSSLKKMNIDASDYEIIFVDDCSTDGTFEYLEVQASSQSNWKIEKLKINSGSPSRPRNQGIQIAKGDYVFFLDCDDEILSDTLTEHLRQAKTSNACIIRGYLIADDGKNQREMNRLTDWNNSLSNVAKIEKIIGKQSTTVPNLIKREVLIFNRIMWPEDIRVGEDSVFLVNLLINCQIIDYIDHPTFIYNKRSSFNLSSTQEYGSRELNNHLIVWKIMINILAKIDINYTKVRLRVGLQTAIQGLIFKNKHDVLEHDFVLFSEFVNLHKSSIDEHGFASHIRQVLHTLYDRDFDSFTQSCKPRLVIAGHDLKFISPLIDKLKTYFAIKIDEWSGHNQHNPIQSEEMLEWADYIWCEWLLGNAVWYSQRKKSHQKLIVRMHRFELGREFGEQVNTDNIDVVVAVSVLFFERLIERFPNIHRARVRLIHNYVDAQGYHQSNSDERQFNIALIGIVPYRKGLYKGLEILKQLKFHDSRYQLKIFGTEPKDIPWLQKHDVEMKYYKKCDEFIANNDLVDSVSFLGHCDIKSALAQHNVGYVLSLSENTQGYPGPESFHLAIADGFAAGTLSLIVDWDGCEYIYPSTFIKESTSSIVKAIVETPPSSDQYASQSELGKQLLLNKYSVEQFIQRFRNVFNVD
jgi:poly(ribitol-phosphate) beta-N-acetylglucosaminyltransferase